VNRIAELRRERRLTQTELGIIVHKTKFAISKWESSTNDPSQDDLDILCEVLGADSDYLMGRTDINTRRIELRGNQLPENLRDAGLEYVQMLREYVDEQGGIRADVQKELLRLVAEAKLLPDKDTRMSRPRKRQAAKTN
jgi:transcriptional regulator with XRE-family HTH domain